MTINTRSRGSFASVVHAPRGAGCLGIDWRDVDGKYRTLTPRAGLSDTAIEHSLALIHRFEELAEVVPLLEAIGT